jgi:hypothetical protein
MNPLIVGKKQIKTVYDLLDVIRERSGMWIGDASITRLSSFLDGFHVGLGAADRELDPETPAFQDFHDWVATRLGRSKNGHGWSSMLLEAADGDEQSALDAFWKELDAFRLAAR